MTSHPGDGRKGDWIQTYTGRAIWVLDPRPDEIDIRDIAHMLAMKCRFSGATRRFYSVAQHSILLSYAVPSAIAYAALHHDDTEAYLPDVPTPVKPFLVGFKELERTVEAVVCAALGVDQSHMALVKPYDVRILTDERDALLNPSELSWSFTPEPLGIAIDPWGPEEAEARFLARHAELAPAAQ
jgi:hypothetical protein